jgi:Tol biopolymer transport system component
MKRSRAGGVVFLVASVTPITAGAQVIERISVSSAGLGGNGASALACRTAPITADGRYVVFQSDAPDLVANDVNGVTDVFLRDRLLGTTTRLSVDTAGGDADGPSMSPCIARNGRWVVFASDATDLVPDDTAGFTDVFVRDLQSGTTVRISVDADGGEADGGSRNPSITDDGRFVVFASDAADLVAGDGNGEADIFLRDIDSGLNERVSVDVDGNDPDANSWTPIVNADGRYVAFHSGANDLVPGDGGGADIFVRDRQLAETVRASADPLGGDPDGTSYGATISGDGRHVLFWSYATNLVPGDTNGFEDVFVHDLDPGTTSRVSLRGDGGQITDLPSRGGALSSDGRHVVFKTASDQPVAGDVNGAEDVFSLDRATGELLMLSRNAAGVQGDGNSNNPKITPGAEHVLFQSAAANLVDGDLNGAVDVFLCRGPAAIFADGFETGDDSGWSSVSPP